MYHLWTCAFVFETLGFLLRVAELLKRDLVLRDLVAPHLAEHARDVRGLALLRARHLPRGLVSEAADDCAERARDATAAFVRRH